MIKNKQIFYLLTLCFVSLLASCSSNKNVFSTEKKSYDPFSVYSYSSLILPPVYYISSQEISDKRRFMNAQSQVVKDDIFGDVASAQVKNPYVFPSSLTPGDKKFLTLASADKDFSGVKQKLDLESSNLVQKDASFLQKIKRSHKDESLTNTLGEYVKYNNREN